MFAPYDPVTTPWGPHLTGGLLAAAAALLAVRLAGRSWWYEPRVWRRDLFVASGLAAAAVASTLLWPQSVPYFWGSRTAVHNETAQVFTESGLPGLGWWLAVLAAAALAVAAGLARVPDTSTPSHTSDK